MFIQSLADFIWGIPLAIALIGTGLWSSVRLNFLQFRRFKEAIKLIFKKIDQEEEGDVSHFQALMTSLAATVGTGNIVGVATALAIGGPGALFWMWVTGLIGMATKFAESILGVKYRTKNRFGRISGGPMYYMRDKLKWKWVAGFFAAMGAITAITNGNLIQSNSIADVLFSNLQVPHTATAVLLMLLVGVILAQGIKSIGQFAEKVVPTMIFLYIFGGLAIIVTNIAAVPDALALIFKQAFTPTGAAGGFAGSALLITIRMGLARGLFSNESGLGSAPVIAAAARTRKPITQGLISMTQTFIDTIIVCSITGLVIITTGAWTSGLNGASLTSHAFGLGIPYVGNFIVVITLLLFAFSTIIGWSYFGEKFLEYLFDERVIKGYRFIYVGFVGVGALLHLELVWAMGDVAAALMTLPNLIAIIFLTKVVVREAKEPT